MNIKKNARFRYIFYIDLSNNMKDLHIALRNFAC